MIFGIVVQYMVKSITFSLNCVWFIDIKKFIKSLFPVNVFKAYWSVKIWSYTWICFDQIYKKLIVYIWPVSNSGIRNHRNNIRDAKYSWLYVSLNHFNLGVTRESVQRSNSLLILTNLLATFVCVNLHIVIGMRYYLCLVWCL